jgi:hypothetical protein
MERGIRPIADAGDQAVLDRIDIAIRDVAAEILIVADQVFPKPALPDASFAARNAHRASRLGVGDGFRKDDFDQPPAQRKIGVDGRQRPNRMDMIGQHHHSVDRKRAARLRKPRRRAQRVDMVRQKAASLVQQIDSEEPASARHKRYGDNSAWRQDRPQWTPAARAEWRQGGMAALTEVGGAGAPQLLYRNGAMRCAYCALRSATSAANVAPGLTASGESCRRQLGADSYGSKQKGPAPPPGPPKSARPGKRPKGDFVTQAQELLA